MQVLPRANAVDERFRAHVLTASETVTIRSGLWGCSCGPWRSPISVAMRLRRGYWFALAIAIVAIFAAAVAAQARQTQSSGQLMHAALTDAIARGSVHEVESEATPSIAGTLTDDLATHEGRQNIVHSGGETAHVLVVGGAAYLSGNQAALVHYFGLPATVAREVGSRWVSVPSSSSGYSTVAADATLPSAMASLAIPGHTTETAPTTIDGQSVIGIRGSLPVSGSPHAAVTATIYVSRASSPLPVRAIYTEGKGSTETVSLSHWGETVALKAPTNVIPASQLKQ
jgi:hypothetical protein